MQKQVFIELVFLRVNGGNLSDESAIERVDIEAYLPAAVNYAVTAGRNTNLQIEGNRDYPSLFYGAFTDVVINRSESTPFVNLPKGHMPLAGNEGIRFVHDDCGNYYTPLMDADRRSIKHYSKLLTDQKYFYPLGKKLEIWGLNPLADKLSGEIIIDVNELEADDELPIQAGFETMAMDICYEWITGQRQYPSDKKNNNADINVQQ